MHEFGTAHVEYFLLLKLQIPADPSKKFPQKVTETLKWIFHMQQFFVSFSDNPEARNKQDESSGRLQVLRGTYENDSIKNDTN